MRGLASEEQAGAHSKEREKSGQKPSKHVIEWRTCVCAAPRAAAALVLRRLPRREGGRLVFRVLVLVVQVQDGALGVG